MNYHLIAFSMPCTLFSTLWTRKKYTLGTFLDYSKAFDMADHQLLLRKCYAVGIRGIALNWILSYLRNKYQIVCLTHV
jgi:hypothetical protein